MNIENLALSGGGLKGIVYGGCFQALEECGILKNIKRIAGTSVGALFGYSMLLGFTSAQIQELILKINFTFLRDINIDNILSFHNSFGFDTGNNIEKVLRVTTEKQGLTPDITFEQFHRITGVEFIVVTTCVSKREKVAFSYKTYPNFSVVKAIRISCGLPFIFNATTIDGEDYVDGGLMENTPISFFTGEEDIENTIAFLLNSKMTKYERNLSSYAYSVILCMTETISKLQLDKYSDYILDLDNIKLSSATEITEDEKRDLLKYGYEATMKYIKMRDNRYKNKKKCEANANDNHTNKHTDDQSQNTIERKKKEFSKLTEQINDILNYD
jgi:NTE family protein